MTTNRLMPRTLLGLILAATLLFPIACSAPSGGGGGGDGGNLAADNEGVDENTEVDVAELSAELTLDTRDMLDAAGTDDTAVKTAAKSFVDDALRLYDHDPANAAARVREIVASQIESGEDLRRLYDAEQALSGEFFTLDLGKDAARVTSRRTDRQSADSDRVAIVFVNGVFTRLFGAIETAVALRDRIKAHPSMWDSVGAIGWFYNVSGTRDYEYLFGDVPCPVFDFLDPENSFEAELAEKFGDDGVEDACNHTDLLYDLGEATIEKAWDLFANPDLGSDPAELADVAHQSIIGGMRVVFVGHSQGNFKIEGALDHLDGDYGRALADHVAVLAVGCPAKYQDAKSNGIPVRKFNIRRSSSFLDFAVDWSLPWTALYDNHFEEDLVSLLDTTQPSTEWLIPREFKVFPPVHDFVNSYLDDYGNYLMDGLALLLADLGVGDSGCGTSSDCPDGQMCNTSTGACVECVTDFDCSGVELCSTLLGECVECLSNDDCTDDETCAGGRCVDNTSLDDLCFTGNVTTVPESMFLRQELTMDYEATGTRPELIELCYGSVRGEECVSSEDEVLHETYTSLFNLGPDGEAVAEYDVQTDASGHEEYEESTWSVVTSFSTRDGCLWSEDWLPVGDIGSDDGPCGPNGLVLGHSGFAIWGVPEEYVCVTMRQAYLGCVTCSEDEASWEMLAGSQTTFEALGSLEDVTFFSPLTCDTKTIDVQAGDMVTITARGTYRWTPIDRPDEIAYECSSNAGCNDDDPCTEDTCVNEICVNTPVMCPEGQECVAGVCLMPECAENVDCQDYDNCTNDACVAGVCLNEPVVCPDGQVCEEGRCVVVDGPGCLNDADCDDGDACTTDACMAGACVNTPITCPEFHDCIDGTCTAREGVPCEDSSDCDDGLYCNGIGACDDGVCVFMGEVCSPGMVCNEEYDYCEQP